MNQKRQMCAVRQTATSAEPPTATATGNFMLSVSTWKDSTWQIPSLSTR